MVRLLIFILFATIVGMAGADPAPIILNPDDQRIMLLKLSDGTILTDALVLYPRGQLWYLPIGEISRKVGFAIDVDAVRREAKGQVLNRFSILIDAAQCTTKIDAKLIDYPCDQALPLEDDIYIESHLFETWLGVKLEINTFSSEVNLVPSYLLPIQEQAERERRASELRRGGGTYDPGYPLLNVPRENLDGFNFDQQISFDHAVAATSSSSTSIRQDSFISGEILGLEALGFLGSSGKKLDRPRLSLQSRSVQQDLLGPLKAREVGLLYFNLPSLPVIGGSAYGIGASISNFP